MWQVCPAHILYCSALSNRSICAVSFCWDALLPFPFFHVGIWYQELTFGSVLLAEGDVLTEVKGAIHAEHFGAVSSPTHGCLLKRCFGLTVAYWIMRLWHLNSLLDLFYLGPWGGAGLVFSPLMCLKSQAICITAPLLWFFDSFSGEHSDVQSSALCASAAWDVFVVCFCTGHESPFLLPSLQIVMKAGYCWPVILENLCLLKAIQKIQYFMRNRVPSLGGDGWHCRVALQQCSDFHSDPFLCVLKKSYHCSSLIKRIFITFCCICSFLMIFTEVPGEEDS